MRAQAAPGRAKMRPRSSLLQHHARRPANDAATRWPAAIGIDIEPRGVLVIDARTTAPVVQPHPVDR